MSKDTLISSGKSTLFGVIMILCLSTTLILDSSLAVSSDIPTQSQKPAVSVIFDTDLDSDVDDVGALAVLHALANNGEAEILGIIVTSDDMHSPLCADAINTYFQRPDIPIGVNKKMKLRSFSRYNKGIAEEYPHDLQSYGDAEDATSLYRKILSSQPDNSIVIITVGHLTNLKNLLLSQADVHSPLGGIALVKKKVKLWSCMGGKYPKGKEPNFYRPDSGSTSVCVNSWPNRVVFSGAEIGNPIKTGGSYFQKHSSPQSPVRRAYELYNNFGGRSSWDQTAVLYAIRGDNHWWYVHTQGHNYVFPDGSNEWSSSPDKDHGYLIENAKPEEMVMIIDQLMIQEPDIPANINEPGNKVPVIYCTDLFHPHEDPDDHFDIACLYAIPEIDIKGIILDQGGRQKKQPGSIPISQLNHITGKNIPYAIGLANKLESPEDKGLKQSKEYQNGVELILSTLKTSKEPVTIISVGSLRDVAASYNRSPSLFKSRVNKLLIFIGEASQKGHIEYNVGLDKNAYRRIMNSGLPVYWVPCFDGGLWQNKGSASYWKASHKDLLENVSSRVMNYFVYALLKKNEGNPIQYLNRKNNNDDKEKVLLMNRNLWCTAVFPYIAERRFVRHGEKVISIPVNASYNKELEVKPFDFNEVSVFVDEQGNVFYEDTARSKKINQFRVIGKETYPEVMTSIAAQLLFELDH